jgi:glycosyltransferase involved in cell wall biosynthesis
MSSPSRRLLVVAFHYPPDNTSTGVLRTLKFTEYLQDSGWLCDVVTAPERLYDSVDYASVPGIPATTRVFRPWGADTKRIFGLRGRYPAFLGIPDRYWPWILPAARKCNELLNGSNSIRAIFTTYPVPSALLVGLLLKKRHRLPWLADFRDPWVENSMPKFRQSIEGYWERRVMAEADRVICNTNRMRDWFIKRYPGINPDKFVTITNGYDQSALAGVKAVHNQKFEIVYGGVITAVRNPGPLLAAARLAIDRGWIREADLRITFLGAGPYGASRTFLDEISTYSLQSIVEVTRHRIPYAQALQRTASSHVVLVLTEPPGDGAMADAQREWTQLQVPVKAYEALGLRRRIIALASGGAIKDLVVQTQCGIAVAPSDIEQIAKALRDLYTDWLDRNVGPPVNEEALMRYERRALTKQLASELEMLINTKG